MIFSIGLLTLNSYRLIFPCDGTGKEGPVSTASLHCRFYVQRLRVEESAISTLGSQMPDPRTLRPGRPSGLNMPHPTRPGVQGKPSCSAAPAMGQRAAVKRWHTAQTAASSKWRGWCETPTSLHRHPSESWGPACLFSKEGSGMPASAGMTDVGSMGLVSFPSTRRAFAQQPTTLLRPHGPEAWQGTIPPLSFPTRKHGAMR
jgi:hypothetical protein